MAGSVVPVPPILNVAPLPTVNVPPLLARSAVNVDKSNVPDEGETFRSPPTLTLANNVALTVVPLKVRLPPIAVRLAPKVLTPVPLNVRW